MNNFNYKNFFEGKKITKQGFGVLGRGYGVVKFLLESGAFVTVTDSKPRSDFEVQIKELENINSTSKDSISSLVESIINKVIAEVNSVKNDNQIRILTKFQTNKSLLWQHESEWRVMISEFCLPIIAGSNQKLCSGVGYKEAKESLINERELIGIKTLDFSSELTIDNRQIDKHLIYTPKLPKPKRIILGWGFQDNDKQGFNTIKEFCERNKIDLIRLKSTVDYISGVFESQIELKFEKMDK